MIDDKWTLSSTELFCFKDISCTAHIYRSHCNKDNKSPYPSIDISIMNKKKEL